MKPRVLNQRTDRLPVNSVYVGRPTRWGNPFREGPDGTREEVVEKYRYWIQKQFTLEFIQAALRGKHLVCWCAPQRCHADVLLELANKESSS